MQMANTLAYYDMAIITAVKSFIVQALEQDFFAYSILFIFSNIDEILFFLG